MIQQGDTVEILANPRNTHIVGDMGKVVIIQDIKGIGRLFSVYVGDVYGGYLEQDIKKVIQGESGMNIKIIEVPLSWLDMIVGFIWGFVLGVVTVWLLGITL